MDRSVYVDKLAKTWFVCKRRDRQAVFFTASSHYIAYLPRYGYTRYGLLI